MTFNHNSERWLCALQGIEQFRSGLLVMSTQKVCGLFRYLETFLLFFLKPHLICAGNCFISALERLSYYEISVKRSLLQPHKRARTNVYVYIDLYNSYRPRCRQCRDSRVSKLLSAEHYTKLCCNKQPNAYKCIQYQPTTQSSEEGAERSFETL